MKHLISIKKIVYHAWAKNGELQYSFYGAGDYENNDFRKEGDAEEVGRQTCQAWNAMEEYDKYTFEIVRLYGECSEW